MVQYIPSILSNLVNLQQFASTAPLLKPRKYNYIHQQLAPSKITALMATLCYQDFTQTSKETLMVRQKTLMEKNYSSE